MVHHHHHHHQITIIITNMVILVISYPIAIHTVAKWVVAITTIPYRTRIPMVVRSVVVLIWFPIVVIKLVVGAVTILGWIRTLKIDSLKIQAIHGIQVEMPITTIITIIAIRIRIRITTLTIDMLIRIRIIIIVLDSQFRFSWCLWQFSFPSFWTNQSMTSLF